MIFHLLIFFMLLSHELVAEGLVPSCATASCHQQTQVGKSVHGPSKAKGCLICHQAVLQSDGKHQKVRTITLRETNEVCFTCHDELKNIFLTAPFLHSAIQKKSCVSCHDPHSSPYPKLLKESSSKELCLSCHKKMEEASGSHQGAVAGGQGCLNCHTIHYSQHSHLLKRSQPMLCFSCHAQKIKTDQGHIVKNIELFLRKNDFKHTPVRENRCTACHSPHGSLEKNLLDPKNESYKEKSYLCFKCHKRALYEQERAIDETRFRNGFRNLHFVHMKKEGRSCTLCHDVHATQSQNLIKGSFSFLGQEVPIQYEKIRGGGSCATMCHKELAYNRNHAVTNELDR